MTREGMEKAMEKLSGAISVLMLLETDQSMEQPDGVAFGAVRVVHGLLEEVRTELAGQTGKEGT